MIIRGVRIYLLKQFAKDCDKINFIAILMKHDCYIALTTRAKDGKLLRNMIHVPNKASTPHIKRGCINQHLELSREIRLIISHVINNAFEIKQ